MTNTVFFDCSYIVASILGFKAKYLNKAFVSIGELNYVSDQLQKKFNELNISAIILDSLDTDFFEVTEDTIRVNKLSGLSMEDLIYRYQGFLSTKIISLIWNEDFIFNYLSEYMLNEMERMAIKFRNNESRTLKQQDN